MKFCLLRHESKVDRKYLGSKDMNFFRGFRKLILKNKEKN